MAKDPLEERREAILNAIRAVNELMGAIGVDVRTELTNLICDLTLEQIERILSDVVEPQVPVKDRVYNYAPYFEHPEDTIRDLKELQSYLKAFKAMVDELGPPKEVN